MRSLGIYKRLILKTNFGMILFVSLLMPSAKVFADSDFLWNVVSKECVPNQKKLGSPAPCEEVIIEKDGQHGHVIFKDRNGPLQYLLMPTTKITGIESPDLLKADEPNYFYRAWQARSFLVKKFGQPIDDQDVSLAVNSQRGRSQNQLHIHISCLRPDVRDLIQSEFTKKTSPTQKSTGENLKSKSDWQEFPGGLLGHKYLVRSISLEQLKSENVFDLLAQLANGDSEAKQISSPFGEKDDKPQIGDFGLALVALSSPQKGKEFLLLADRANLLSLNRGHVEEIQDHTCPQLYKSKNNLGEKKFIE